MNLRKLNYKTNINEIILTKESTLEMFIKKYNITLFTPDVNIKLRHLTIYENHFDNRDNSCKAIIDLTNFRNRKCLTQCDFKDGHKVICYKCVLFHKNEKQVKLLFNELKKIQ